MATGSFATAYKNCLSSPICLSFICSEGSWISQGLTLRTSTLTADPPLPVEPGEEVAQRYGTAKNTHPDSFRQYRHISGGHCLPRPGPGRRPTPLLPERRRSAGGWQHIECCKHPSCSRASPPSPPCKFCKLPADGRISAEERRGPRGELRRVDLRYRRLVVDAVLGITQAYGWRLSR